MSTYEMNTYELLEFAALDAHGLLDEQEREAFEQAFTTASPALQAQVRREQARLAQTDACLPSVEPPVGLKSRVMAAVKDAIGFAETSERAVVVGVENVPAPLRLTPDILPSRGVNHWWRAAAIGAMAAALVFGFATLQMRADYKQIEQQQEMNAIADLFREEFNVRFQQALFSENTRFVSFSPAEEEFAGRAVVMLDPVRKTGQILVKDLPKTGGEYSLVVVDADGKPTGTAVVTFPGTGNGVADKVFNATLDNGEDLAIIAPGPGGKPTLVLSTKNNS